MSNVDNLRQETRITIAAISDEAGRARSWVSWDRIRIISEFQVLTRASFLMLILVPTLAFYWTSINPLMIAARNATEEVLNSAAVAVNEVESAVVLAGEQLGENCSSAKQGCNITEVEDAILEAAPQISTASSNSFLKAANEIPENLPMVWMLTFFASLFAVAAQLAYQIYAPSAVKRAGLDEHVALHVERELSTTTVDGFREYYQEFVQQLSEDYVALSNQGNVLRFICSTCYLIGILGIAAVLITQSIAVFTATFPNGMTG